MSQPRDANHPQPHMTPEPSQVRPHSIREYKQTPLWATPPGANAPQDPSMAGEDDAILFNGLHEAYGFFSNFAAYPIILGGKTWPTNEHYFQAQKFAGTDHEEVIRLAKSPMIAARMGRSRQRPLRADWERVKDDVMYQAVRAKFTQHDDLRRALLATGAARIVEHRPRDAYWGDGPDGSGKNMLGLLLMRVRAELRTQLAEAEPATYAATTHDDT